MSGYNRFHLLSTERTIIIMPQPNTEKFLEVPDSSWLDRDVVFFMKSRNWLRRRRDLGWLLTYRPAIDTEEFGPRFPTWNVTSALVYPDGTPCRRLRNTPKQIGWVGLRPCTLNSLHSAKLETTRLKGPESDGLYLHSYTADNIGTSLLTAAGRALGHTVLCAPNNDRAYFGDVAETLRKLGYTPNTTELMADGGDIRDLPDIWDYGANELFLDDTPHIKNRLPFPALRPYSEADIYRLAVHQHADS